MPIDPPPKNPILLACKLGAPELVLSLLAHQITPPPDINEVDEFGYSPLAYALQNPRLMKAKLPEAFIAAGACPDITTNVWNEPSYYRNDSGPVQTHSALLALNCPEPLGNQLFDLIGPTRMKELLASYPLLNKAIETRAYWAARRFISEYGCDVNRVDPKLGPPALFCKDIEGLGILLTHGAHVCSENSGFPTALEFYFGNGASAEMQEVLLDAAKKEVDSKISKGKKLPEPLRKALGCALIKSITDRNKVNLQMIWKTLGRKNCLMAKDSTGQNVLAAAIKSKQVTLAKRFLAAGVDPNEGDLQGKNSIFYFLTLPYDRIEKDNRCVKRRLLWDEMLPKIDFKLKNSAGLDLSQQLWDEFITERGSMVFRSIAKAIWNKDQWHPTLSDENGSFFLPQAAEIYLNTTGSPDSNKASGNDELGATFEAMLDEALGIETNSHYFDIRQEGGLPLTPDQAQKMAETLFGDTESTKRFWARKVWWRSSFFGKAQEYAQRLELAGAHMSTFQKTASLAQHPELLAWFETRDLAFLEAPAPVLGPRRNAL